MLWLWHFLYSVGPHQMSSLHIYPLCHGHSWWLRLAKQETMTPPGHLVSPLVCRGLWMSTAVLYCWCHSDSASVLLYFTNSCFTIIALLLSIYGLNVRDEKYKIYWNKLNQYLINYELFLTGMPPPPHLALVSLFRFSRVHGDAVDLNQKCYGVRMYSGAEWVKFCVIM